jgi:hypothetical protein
VPLQNSPQVRDLLLLVFGALIAEGIPLLLASPR